MRCSYHFVCSLTAALSVLPAAGEVPSFQGLGDLPGGEYLSAATDVSGDGTVVVGYSRSDAGPTGGAATEGFRWENGVMTGFGDIPSLPTRSRATGISADGSTIIGESTDTNLAYRWKNGQTTVIGDFPGGRTYSTATGVSADGAVVVGTSESAAGFEGYRWENDVMTPLGDLPGGGTRTVVEGVSDGAGVIVGMSSSAAGSEAFRWEDGVMMGLGFLPDKEVESRAYATSADGSVVVGYSKPVFGSEAFRWENDEMTGLGDLPGGLFLSRAYDVSPDGSVIVGSAAADAGMEAFIWDSGNGMRSLPDLLASDLGLNLSGWTLLEASGVSDDGMTIVGIGTNPSGDQEGWIARIPEPVTLWLLALGSATVMNRRRR
jgi:probable HAF family extracellular repeat protein